LFEAFEIFYRELPAELEKKLEDATVREVPQRFIDARASDIQQNTVQNERLIQF